MTTQEAAKIWMTLDAAFPRAHQGLAEDLLEARRQIYRNVMLSWHYETALAAVKALLLVAKFFPSIAELREHYSSEGNAHPERLPAQSVLPSLPAKGETVASPEQVRAACARVYEKLGVNPLEHQRERGEEG